MKQSRMMSLVETASNVVVGYALAILTQIIVFPWFGIEAGLGEHLAIGLAFVGVSLVRGYVRYLRDQALRAQAGAPDYAAERARFIRARADLAEMEAEQRRGALIAAEEIEAAWIAVLALMRTRLLALPDRLAPLAHEQTTVGGTRNLIRATIREVLDDLAETHVEPEPDPEGVADPDPDSDASAADTAPAAGTDDQ